MDRACMAEHLIAQYEEQFRAFIMNKTLHPEAEAFGQYLEVLANEKEEDYHSIHAAYVNVKRELTG